MLLYNKDLIVACSQAGLSERSYYRRMNTLKEKKLFNKKTFGNTLSLEEARQIASALGFAKEFEDYLIKQKQP